MPTYQITAPDGGTYEVGAPEGATEQEVLAYFQQNYKSAAGKVEQVRPSVQQPVYDWERGGGATGNPIENFVAGVGKEVSDLGLAARQIGAEFGIGKDSVEALRQEAIDKDRLDAELMGTGGGIVGSLVTSIGTSLIPGAGAMRLGKALPYVARAASGVAGGATGGALSGAFEPELEEGGRETAMEVGAGLGVIPFLSKLGPKHLMRGIAADEKRAAAKIVEQRIADRAAQAAAKADAARAVQAEEVARLAAEGARIRALREGGAGAGGRATAGDELPVAVVEGSLPVSPEVVKRELTDILSGGKDTTAAVQALRNRVVDTYSSMESAANAAYTAAERGLAKEMVTVGKNQLSVPQVRQRIRELNDKIATTRDLAARGTLLKRKGNLETKLSEWGAANPEKYAPLAEADQLFKGTVGKARADLNIRGRGLGLHNKNLMSVEAINAALRNPAKGPAMVVKLTEMMPGEETTALLRQTVGALGAEDLKYLTSPTAKRALSPEQLAKIEAMIAALRNQ